MGAPNWTGIPGDDILCEMVVCGAGWISLCVSIWSGITREAREVDDVMALYCICITPARFEEDRRRFDFDPSLAPCPALTPAPLPWPLSSPSRHPIARQPRRRRRRKKLQRRRPSIQRNQKSFSPRVTLGPSARLDWIDNPYSQGKYSQTTTSYPACYKAHAHTAYSQGKYSQHATRTLVVWCGRAASYETLISGLSGLVSATSSSWAFLGSRSPSHRATRPHASME